MTAKNCGMRRMYLAENNQFINRAERYIEDVEGIR
jgi:hypothetical protein